MVSSEWGRRNRRGYETDDLDEATESVDPDDVIDSISDIGAIHSARRRTVSATKSAPGDPFLGRTLGSYRLLSLLGAGGMGRVYRAEHTMLGRQVALKLLRPEYAARRDAVDRFFREARAVNAIGHKNIVDITDYVALKEGETFFIMELLEGSSLGSWIRERGDGIPRHEALRIALQVCDALEAAHEKEIIHRDLKPDNIFILDQGEKGLFVKLLDFGVAKLVGEAAEETSWETAAGSVLGTPAYMSPEQATGSSVDQRTDIYSLGAILYEMFTGRPLFKAKSFGEFVMRHMNDAPVPPNDLPNIVPLSAGLEQVILRCLEKDPENRYSTASDLRDDLVRATATMERAIRRPFARRNASPSKNQRALFRRRRFLALFVLGAGVLLVAGLAFSWAAGLFNETGNGLRSSPTGLQRPASSSEVIVTRRPSTIRSLTPTPTPDERDPELSSARQRAHVRLYSQPSGAAVYRGDTEISLGRTPLVLALGHPPNTVKFTFRLAGYRDVSERVRVTDNAVVAVTLRRRQKKTTPVKPKRSTSGSSGRARPRRTRGGIRKNSKRLRKPAAPAPRRKAPIEAQQTLDPFS